MLEKENRIIKKYNKYIITLVRKIDYVSVNTILLHVYDNEKKFNLARKKLLSVYIDLNIFVSYIAYDKGNNFHLDITIK